MKLLLRCVFGLFISHAVVGCGGGSSGPDSDATFSLSGSVSGLKAGSSLTLSSRTATDATWQTSTIKDNGPFTLAMPVKSNGSYAVTVSGQPPGQTCSIGNSSGAGIVSNVTNLAVQCSEFPFTIGGSVSGLATGARLTILNNNADSKTITSNGNFRFDLPVAQNGSYSVTVENQPTNQVCSVSRGSGSGLNVNVDNVSVVCSEASYKVSVNVVGLREGTQITLFNNRSDPLTITKDGTYGFNTPISVNGNYAVTFATEPKDQTCSISNNTGVITNRDISNVSIVCSDVGFKLSGLLTGLSSGKQLTIVNNAESPTTLSTNGPFSITNGSLTPLPVKIPRNGSYAVAVSTQPVGQTCTVNNGTGKDVVADISNVSIVCSDVSFKLMGRVIGLRTGDRVTLNNGSDDTYTVVANGSFEFPKRVAFLGSYAVTVSAQPNGQLCSVNGSTGSKVAADVTNVEVICNTKALSVGGLVTGLAPSKSLTLFNNAAAPLIVEKNGAFTFTNSIASGGGYSVEVGTQPIGQTCAVNNGSGSGAITDISSVRVVCSDNRFKVSGKVVGLAENDRVILTNNGGDEYTALADGDFEFSSRLPFGGVYAVEVKAQPNGKLCTVSGRSGQGVTADITNVAVICSARALSVSGLVTGLASGKQLTLYNNAGTLNVTSNGAFTFPNSIASGGGYSVAVAIQPIGQTCTVLNGTVDSGISADVSNVNVVCDNRSFTVGGLVTGLGTQRQVTLYNNATDPRTIDTNGPFTFASPIAAGSGFEVVVGTQPVDQTCTVSGANGSGVVANVSTVRVDCGDNIYPLKVDVTGLQSGKTVVLLNNGIDILRLSQNGNNYAFPKMLAYNQSYNVSVATQPIGQTCNIVSGRSGTGISAAVANVLVTCQ